MLCSGSWKQSWQLKQVIEVAIVYLCFSVNPSEKAHREGQMKKISKGWWDMTVF